MEDSLSCEKDPRSNPVVSPSLSSQGAAEWFGGGTTPFEELLSLLPLQTRHVERSEQEDSKGIAPPPAGRRTLNLPADPLCVRERPVGARSLPELCLFFFFFSSSLKLAPFREASVSPPGPLLVCLFVWGKRSLNFCKRGVFRGGQTWVSTLPHWLNYCTERRELFLFSFSLSLFFFGCDVFRQTGKQLILCARVCVCASVFVWVRGCVYIYKCTRVCCPLVVTGSTFFF